LGCTFFGACGSHIGVPVQRLVYQLFQPFGRNSGGRLRVDTKARAKGPGQHQRCAVSAG
jgi:hypothetical protein